MITFSPRDILMLALLLAAACAVGFAIGYVLRRLMRRGAPLDMTRAVALFSGFWAFGMLFSLTSDLVTSAGKPFWLKIVLLALLIVLVASFGIAEWRAFVLRYGGPREPIHAGGPEKKTTT